MKKYIVVILCVLLGKIQELKSQCLPDVNKLKFSGVAPAPWAINGLVNDWQTILGPFTGNNINPYSPPALSRFNWATDKTGINDLDNPEPGSDLSFTAFIHDDYNVYFYLRKLVSSNAPNSFYYFCDINADGFMNSGEPVFGAHFNAQNVSELTVYKYVPDQNKDYISGKGNWMISPGGLQSDQADGYTITGSVERVFGGHAIPSAYTLNAHEVFKAEITENGNGIELAIPWKYFRNWNTLSVSLTPAYIFTYHLALQKTPAKYRPQLVQDNAGNCCGRLSVSGNAAYDVTGTNISRNPDGSFRLKVTLQNQTNISEAFFLSFLSFKNIQLNGGSNFNPGDFLVTVYPDLNGNGNIDPGESGTVYFYFDGTFLNQPINYLPNGLIGAQAFAGSFGTAKFIVDIHLPANNSVFSLSVELNIPSRFEGFLRRVYCYDNVGGGKGINPVAFEITTEEERPVTGFKNDQDYTMPGIYDKLKVYPNPSKGTVTILLPGSVKDADLSIQDVSGKLFYHKSGINNSVVTVQDLIPGFYLLRVISKDSGKQFIQKLVVR